MATTDLSAGFLDSLREEQERLREAAAERRMRAADYERQAATLALEAEALEQRLRDLEAVLEPEEVLPPVRDEPLRGRAIWEAALEALFRRHSQPVEIHYRQWFDLVVLGGRTIAGKDPLASFLTQVGRCPLADRVVGRAGYYRVDLALASRRAVEERRSAAEALQQAVSDDQRRAERRSLARAEQALAEVSRWRQTARIPASPLTVVSSAG